MALSLLCLRKVPKMKDSIEAKTRPSSASVGTQPTSLIASPLAPLTGRRDAVTTRLSVREPNKTMASGPVMPAPCVLPSEFVTAAAAIARKALAFPLVRPLLVAHVLVAVPTP